MCAFRHGRIKDAHDVLMDMHSPPRPKDAKELAKELLAQVWLYNLFLNNYYIINYYIINYCIINYYIINYCINNYYIINYYIICDPLYENHAYSAKKFFWVIDIVL